MTLLRRRHPTDIADLATLQVQLDRERAHSRDLAEQLADVREFNRRVVTDRDEWRGRARDLVGQLTNLKAKARKVS